MYKETLKFLKDLSKNNNKAWFDENHQVYEKVRLHFFVIVDEIIAELSRYDKDLIGLTSKDCVFRINKDVRFAQDKSPYKLSFSAFLAKGGRKSGLPGYYFHIQPGNKTLVGGGIYMPNPDQLLKIRQEINHNGITLEKIISNSQFKKLYPKIEGESLKKIPRGFEESHKYGKFLRQKQFFVMYEINDKEVVAGKFSDIVCHSFRQLIPFNKFFSKAIN